MSTFYLAPSLVTLRDEINNRFPERDKTSDGWIGDTSHAARASDHNPDWAEGGVVRAIDIDIDGRKPDDDLVQVVLKAVIGDSRVYYVIFNGKIYSRTYGWVARIYTGSNPHDKHIHVSVRDDDTSERNIAPWLEPQKIRTKPKPIAIDVLREQARQVRSGQRVAASHDVKRLQKALNAKYGIHLKVDGVMGKSTLDSYARHERAVGGKGGARVPDWQSLPSLVKGRFYVTKEAAK